MMGAHHTFTEARTPIAFDADDLATVPEWAMSTEQWIAHQDRRHGQDWRAAIERMDAEAADSAWNDWFGGEAWDAAPDLSAHRCATVGMSGEGSAPHALPGVV